MTMFLIKILSIHSDYSHPSPSLPYEPQPPSHLTMEPIQDTHAYGQTTYGSQHASHQPSPLMVAQSAPGQSSYYYSSNDLPSTRSYENLPPMDITRLPPSYYMPSAGLHYGSQGGDSYSRPPALQWPLLNQDSQYTSSLISKHRVDVADTRYRPSVGAW